MGTSPQTNTTLEEIARAFVELDDFVICGHVSPDGDCIGSQLGLAWALKALGKRVTCVLAEDAAVDPSLAYLPGAHDLIKAADYHGHVGAFVATDVPIVSRLGTAASLHERASVRFTIDHHEVPTTMAEYTYVYTDAPATGMLVWNLIKLMGLEPTPPMATCLYAALMTDTGRFQYHNTTADALFAAAEMVRAGADPALASREAYQRRTRASLELERRIIENMQGGADGAWVPSRLSRADFDACNAVKADADPLVDVLRSLEGVRVSCILREQDSSVRGSLRAKDPTLDVSTLARTIGGGGHKAAAGFTFEGSLAQARELLPGYLDRLCEDKAR